MNPSNMFGLNIDYANLIMMIIQKLLLENDVSIVLIPHNNAPVGDIESDLEACETIFQKIPENLKDRVHISEGRNSPSEIKGVISNCPFFFV